MKCKTQQKGYIFFTVTAVFCGLIWSVTNISYDCVYQISMSHRLLSGDKMILEMWEPHQTSVFLPALLMWLYEKVFHTTTGIVLYLQFWGILIRGAIAALLYRIFCWDLKRPPAYGMALLFFMISPKDYALPEFANMQLWYSALLFCCLYAYLKKGKRILLVGAALFLCLEVLAYPSCLIVYPGIVGLLFCFSQDRRRDILLFTGVCAGAGGAVGGYFLMTLGADTFLRCLKGMMSLEPSHTVSIYSKLLGYLKDVLETFPIYLAAGAGAFLLSRLLCIVFHKESKPGSIAYKREKRQLWLLSFAGILLAGFFLNILSAENRSAYSLLLLFIAAVGLCNKKSLTGEEKKLYCCLNVIGALGFLSTLLLSDMPFLPSVPYGLLGVMAACIPISRTEVCMEVKRGIYLSFGCFVALLAFRCAYIRTPLTGRAQICSVFSDLSVVRTGPAFGIISDESGVCIQRDSYPEWKEFIRPGDKVWIIGSVVDTLGYLYEDVEVAGPSTMSTPSYNSAVSEYWRINPDKYPDVVVAESYMGSLVTELTGNEWFQSWLEKEYQPELVVEGTYWTYYFKKAR